MTVIIPPGTSIFFVLIVLIMGCAGSKRITDVNYSRPLESLLLADSHGMVEDHRHGLKFSVLPLQFEEWGDSSSVRISTVRMIRVRSGKYLLTASDFEHVYVLKPDEHSLIIDQRVRITDKGLLEPAFNVREHHIELLDSGTGSSVKLIERKNKVEVVL